jgi:hypothetical protein
MQRWIGTELDSSYLITESYPKCMSLWRSEGYSYSYVSSVLEVHS